MINNSWGYFNTCWVFLSDEELCTTIDSSLNINNTLLQTCRPQRRVTSCRCLSQVQHMHDGLRATCSHKHNLQEAGAELTAGPAQSALDKLCSDRTFSNDALPSSISGPPLEMRKHRVKPQMLSPHNCSLALESVDRVGATRRQLIRNGLNPKNLSTPLNTHSTLLCSSTIATESM